MVVEYIIGGVVAVAFVIGVIVFAWKMGKDLRW